MWYPAVLLGVICLVGSATAYAYGGQRTIYGEFFNYKTVQRNEINQTYVYPKERMGTIYMVGVKPTIFLSSAQMKYLHVTNPLEEQIVLMEPEKREVIVHPGFGFLSFANNIAVVKKDMPLLKFAKVKKGYPREIGKELITYEMSFLPGIETSKKTKIVNFTKCQEAFESYNLDENEQICTSTPDEPPAFLSGILFDESGDVPLVVGITSIRNNEYTVSTFVPYHCDHPLLAIHDICSE